jgi:hypothetical protein
MDGPKCCCGDGAAPWVDDFLCLHETESCEADLFDMPAALAYLIREGFGRTERAPLSLAQCRDLLHWVCREYDEANGSGSCENADDLAEFASRLLGGFRAALRLPVGVR